MPDSSKVCCFGSSKGCRCFLRAPHCLLSFFSELEKLKETTNYFLRDWNREDDSSVVLLGMSGAGKSFLCNMICRLTCMQAYGTALDGIKEVCKGELVVSTLFCLTDQHTFAQDVNSTDHPIFSDLSQTHNMNGEAQREIAEKARENRHNDALWVNVRVKEERKVDALFDRYWKKSQLSGVTLVVMSAIPIDC